MFFCTEKAALEWVRSLLESFTGVESHDGRQYNLDQHRWGVKMGGDEEWKRLWSQWASDLCGVKG